MQPLTFDSMCQSLCNQGKLTFVFEGTPYDFPVKEISDIFNRKIPILDKIELVANKLDYNVNKSSSCIVFTKKYTNKYDVSCVTIDEIKIFLTNLKSVTENLCPHINSPEIISEESSHLLNFVSALKNSVKNPDLNNITVSQLPSDLKSKLFNFFSNFRTSTPIETADAALKLINHYESYNLTSVSNKGLLATRKIYGSQVSLRLDTNIHTPKIQTPKNLSISTIKHETLKDVINKLNSLSNNKIALHNALNEKPFLLFGEQNTLPSIIIDAICKNFNYTIKTTDSGKLLTIPPVKTSRNILEIRQIWVNCFPSSLYRAYLIKQPSLLAQNLPTSNDYRGVEISQAAGEWLNQSLINRGLKDKMVNFKELFPLEKSAFAVALLENFFNTMKTDLADRAGYLEHFNKLTISLKEGIYPNSPLSGGNNSINIQCFYTQQGQRIGCLSGIFRTKL